MTDWRIPQSDVEEGTHKLEPSEGFGEGEAAHVMGCPGCVQLPLEDLRAIMRASKRWVDYAEAWEARHGRR